MAQAIKWTTGEKITANKLNAISDKVSREMRDTLIMLMENVAYTTPDIQERFAEFRQAWELDESILNITATYTQTGPVYNTDNLSSLKSNLVVTAHFTDNTTAVVRTYMLTGTLNVGLSTITVTYSGVSTTFTVQVSDGTILYNLEQPRTFTGVDADTLDTGVCVMPENRDVTILMAYTPTQPQHNIAIFYAGQANSPYNAIAYKLYNAGNYPYPVVETHSTVSGFQVSNIAYGEENRIVIRYTTAANSSAVFHTNATNGTITGTAGNSGIVAPNETLKLGSGYPSLCYIGTISKFTVYTRALPDEDVYAFLNGEV